MLGADPIVVQRLGFFPRTLMLVVPMAAVGFIVARRQPSNPIGWLLLVIPVGVLLNLDAGPYAWLVYCMGYRLPFGPAAVLLENSSWVVLTIALPPALVLFPDGELPSRGLAVGAVVLSNRRHRPVPACLRRHGDHHRHPGRPSRCRRRRGRVRSPIRLHGLGLEGHCAVPCPAAVFASVRRASGAELAGRAETGGSS
jgi:hypothetical protein